MKPTSTLINIARGGIVDDAALAAALRAGTIAAAGLDVFEGEPSVHPDLLSVPNVVRDLPFPQCIIVTLWSGTHASHR